MGVEEKFYLKHGEKPWENPEVVHAFQDGWSIVRVQTPWDYCLETWYLDHCLGSKHFETFDKGHRVFSVRDAFGIPHATVLCLLPEVTSPYMGCADLGTTDYFQIEGELVRVLQVRGRNDELAQRAELVRVAEWLNIELPRSIMLCSAVFGDQDDDYHIRHLLPTKHSWGGWTPASAAPSHGSIERGWLSF